MRLLLPMLALAGCINGDVTLFEVQLVGEVSVTDAAAGPVYLEAHHLSRGQGILEIALGLVHSWSIDAPGEVDETWLHPLEDGTGLVIFAWQDRDDDGVHCTPQARDEPAGLASWQDLDHTMALDLTLTEPCVGPERLVP